MIDVADATPTVGYIQYPEDDEELYPGVAALNVMMNTARAERPDLVRLLLGEPV